MENWFWQKLARGKSAAVDGEVFHTNRRKIESDSSGLKMMVENIQNSRLKLGKNWRFSTNLRLEYKNTLIFYEKNGNFSDLITCRNSKNEIKIELRKSSRISNISWSFTDA